ncbi:MAG TPA: DNA topoisomerase IB [Candidatus Baltobacteraceae bacterium]
MSSQAIEGSNDPAASAKAAGLRYVSDAEPGFTRRLKGKHFVYFAPDGKAITDAAQIARIRALAIPPAYTHVWICPHPNGHLQATGRDARGRKQYRYHKRWREVRDENKYDRMTAFAKALPRMRKRVQADLRKHDLPREKVLAAVVQLLESTLIRVGNDEYAKENDSYGLTTMEGRHVKVHGATMRFSFRGKSGVRHAVGLRDKRLARIVRQCQDLPGQHLFSYVDDDGGTHEIDSADVNDYIRDISGEDFSAKDFRTWLGTLTCALLLASSEAAETATDRKQRVVSAIKEVALRLGNTPAVCRKCYVHPDIVDVYLEDGKLDVGAKARKSAGLFPEERAVLAVLAKRARESDAQRTQRQLRRSLRA